MNRHGLLTLVLCGLFFAPNSARAETYMIDRHHSSVAFDVRHLFSTVHGKFKQFEGVIEHVPGEPSRWEVHAQIETSSIHTKNYQRDQHLRSEEFFDAVKFPEISFKSTGVELVRSGFYRLRGLLKLHGIEKPVSLDLELKENKRDAQGRMRAVFSASTQINRSDFGIDWNVRWDTGDFLLSDKVKIFLDIEAVKKDV